MDNCGYEKADPVEISFMEAALLGDIMDHDAKNLISMYAIEVFAEEGNEPSGKKQTLLNGVIERIQKILSAISRAIQGLFDGIKNAKGGDRLTPEDYMNNPDVQVQLDMDIVAMTQAIDREYLECRKMIKKLSSATGIPIEVIGAASDRLNETLHDNRYKIKNTAKAMVKGSVVLNVSKGITSKMSSIQKDVKFCEDTIERLKARNTPVDPKDLTAWERLTKHLYDINNAYIKTYNTCYTGSALSRFRQGMRDGKTYQKYQNKYDKQTEKQLKREAKKNKKG